MYHKTGRFAGTKGFLGLGEGISPGPSLGGKYRTASEKLECLFEKGEKMLRTDSVKQLEDTMQERSFAAI